MQARIDGAFRRRTRREIESVEIAVTLHRQFAALVWKLITGAEDSRRIA